MVLDFGKQLQNIDMEMLKGTKFGSGARALAVKPDDDTVYLVGTEEGLIHLCTTEYSSRYIATFQAHNTPVSRLFYSLLISNVSTVITIQVYTVEWNTFLPNVFISCAAEWSVKIWDMNNSSPLYTFDVKSPAGDVAWAPYSR